MTAAPPARRAAAPPLSLLALALAVGACEPQTDNYGDLTPGMTIYQAEVDTAAMSGGFEVSLCGNAPGDAELFISGGQDFLMRGTDSVLAGGGSATLVNLPTGDTFTCGGMVEDRYVRLTDNAIVRLPDGRLVDITLAVNRVCFGVPVILQRSFLVRESSDCGATWTVSTIDGFEITLPDSDEPLDLPFLDRQNAYIDHEQNHVYLVFRAAEELFNPPGTGIQKTVVLKADASQPGPLNWTTVKAYDREGRTAGATALAADPFDGSEALYLFECVNFRPQLSILENPVSFTGEGGADQTTIDLEGAPDCRIIAGEITGAALWNAVESPGVAVLGNDPPLAPAPARNLRVVYPGRVVSAGTPYQVAHVLDVSVSLDGTAWAPSSISPIDRSSTGLHVLWTDLQSVDFAPAGLGAFNRHANVLAWTLVAHEADAGAVVGINALNTWRGPLSGWQGTQTLSAHLIDRNKLNTVVDGIDSRFFGDYKYGTFVGAAGVSPRFFVPWSEQDPNVTTGFDASVHGVATTLGFP